MEKLNEILKKIITRYTIKENKNNKITKEENDENRRKKIIAIIVLILLLFFLLIFNVGDILVGRPTRPVLNKPGNDWYNEKVIGIEKDSIAKKKIDHYLYCITDKNSIDGCKWEITKTKNVNVITNGINYVFFKAVDSDGNIGDPSSPVVVKIDNIAPTINSIIRENLKNSIKVSVDAIDNESGIKAYYYKLDDGEWVKGDKDFEFKNLEENKEYNISIRVVDNAGNIKELSLTATTDNSGKTTFDLDDNKNNKAKADDKDKTKDNETKEEPDLTIPSVSLDGIPNEFYYGEDYKIPTNYKFGKSGGKLTCYIDSKETNLTSTKTLLLLKHTIKCDAKGNNGLIASASKEINIKPKEIDEDKEWDGWITMNLKYPENSIKWQWKLDDSAIEQDHREFEDYTGPITVRLNDVEHVLISYEIDGEGFKEYPGTTEPYTYIWADDYSLNSTDKTKVYISYSRNSDKREYKINDGKWQEYKGAFEASADSNIQSRATNIDEIVTADGTKTTKKRSAYDSIYISYDKRLTRDPLSIKIYFDNNSIQLNEETNARLIYTDGAKKIVYSINGGVYTDYTGPFKVKALDNVTAIVYKDINYYNSDGEIVNTKELSASASKDVDVTNYELEDFDFSINAPYSLEENKTSKVSINAPEDSEKILYSINGSDYSEYDKEFEVSADTLVTAMVTKKVKLLDNDGNTIDIISKTKTKSKYIKLKEIEPPIEDEIDGPNIYENPDSLVEEATISMDTFYPSESIWYKEGYYGRYTKYNGEFKVSNNETIYAYYIRKEDGLKSKVSSFKVSNIKKPYLPYIRFESDHDLNTITDNENITVISKDADTVKYSFDNVQFIDYTSPINIDHNCTIYVKAENNYGDTVENLSITNIGNSNPPAIIKNLDVFITSDPTKEEVKGLVNKTNISISFDNDATEKLYSLDGYTFIPYEGPFELKENTTIIAVARGENAFGSAKLKIDFLTTGIAKPDIIPNTKQKAYSVDIDIDYDKTAVKKYYKLNDDTYHEYTGTFTVTENNTLITAYNENALGQSAKSTYYVSNIVKQPSYEMVDKDDYFILKLNYPATTNSNTWEYKWTKDGKWKHYDTKYNLLLIKASAKEKYVNADGAIIEDEYGNKLTYTDHYYFVNDVTSDLAENLFMRWSNEQINEINIISNTKLPTNSVDIRIQFPTGDKYLYKIIDKNGKQTEWKKYNGVFTIKENNTTVLAKYFKQETGDSKIVSYKVTNIDETGPEVSGIADFESPIRKLNVTIKAVDDVEVETVGYAKGKHDVKFFEDDGKFIKNNGTFSVEENGFYTLYASDTVGHQVVKVIEITNIDKNAPDLYINLLDKNLSSKVRFTITGTAKDISYSVGNDTNYKKYNSGDEITLTSEECEKLFNSDGSLTIYAKGINESLNEATIHTNINNLDNNIFAAPVINNVAGYPILTEYGMKLDDYITINYDNNYDDLYNEYSVDGGETWLPYVGPFNSQSGNIVARSTRLESGLSKSNSKKINLPTDAIPYSSFDGDVNTKQNYPGTYKFLVDKTAWNSYLSIIETCHYYSGMTMYFYDDNNNLIKQETLNVEYSSSNNTEHIYLIPENTSYITIGTDHGFGTNAEVNEITLSNEPRFNVKKNYSKIINDGIIIGNNEISIDFYKTSVKYLYKINDGKWKNYTLGKILNIKNGDTLYAKGIDMFGVETRIISSVVSNVPDDCVPAAGTDNNSSTYYYSGYTQYKLIVDKSAFGKYIQVVYTDGKGGFTLRYYNLDDENFYTYDHENSGGSHAAISIIPSDAEYLKINGYSNWGIGYISDIKILSKPGIYNNNKYNSISDKGNKIVKNQIIGINYDSKSIKKLYSFDNKTWNDYTDKFTAKIGDTIYAKAIDADGVETEVSSYKVALSTNALNNNALDGNEKTYESVNGSRLNIDESMYGERINFKTNGNDTVKFFDKQGTEMTVYTTTVTGSGWHEVTVPQASKYMTFTSNYVYEVRPKFEPTIKLLDISDRYPLITNKKVNDVKEGLVSVTYNHLSVRKLYSFDNKTWKDYDGNIIVSLGETLYVKGIDKDGNDTDTVIYKMEKEKDVLQPAAFDNDSDTKVNANLQKAYISESMLGGILDIYNLKTGYVRFFDENNKQISQVNTVIGWTKVGVPTNAKYLAITGTELYEVDPIKIDNNDYPIITESNKGKWDYTKTVAIDYKDSDNKYVHEYSLDSVNWDIYTEPFIVNDQVTVYARETLDGALVSSSSKELHYIDNTVPTIDLDDIPDTFTEGSNYPMPSHFDYGEGKSGGSYSCYIDGVLSDNAADADDGERLLSCEIKTNVLQEYKISKTVFVKDNLEKFIVTGDVQKFIAPKDGIYKVELWGAQGGTGMQDSRLINKGGTGAYTSGNISMKKGESFFVYVGGRGSDGRTQGWCVGGHGGFNGGAQGGNDYNCDGNPDEGGGGGGATDIRLVDGAFDNSISLASRIMVAAGGGGGNYSATGANGGALSGDRDASALGLSTQTSGYKFGIGQVGGDETDGSGGGGGGYYGGTAYQGYEHGGNGGSSFISGYLGSVAISSETNLSPRIDSEGNICQNGSKDIRCSYHYSNYIFTNTVMHSGSEEIPTHNGVSTQTGNTGDGFAKITFVKDLDTPIIRYNRDENLLTEKGVKEAKKTEVNILYPDNTLGKYSLDNKEWLDYTDKVKVNNGNTIYAKAIYFDNSESSVVSLNIENFFDTISSKAFDNNDSTSIDVNKSRLNLDSSILGERIELKGDGKISIKFYDSNNAEITDYSKEFNNETYNEVLVPLNAVYLIVDGDKLSEIRPKYQPTLDQYDNNDLYPIINGKKVNEVDEIKVHITYNHLSVQKLYSTDKENWKEYDGNYAIVNYGDTLYAKGIDKAGNETKIVSIKPEKAKDALDSLTFDNDSDTKADIKNQRLNIGHKLQGSTIDIYNLTPSVIKEMDESNKLLATYNTVVGWDKININENTSFIIITGTEVHEIKGEGNIYVEYPRIVESDNSKWTSTKTVTINYPSDSYNHEYSLDAINWNVYNDSFTIDNQVTIYARETDNNGNIISTSSKKIYYVDNTVPTITMGDLPESITKGDYNKIIYTTNVINEKSSGYVLCINNGVDVNNTSELEVGDNTITCTAYTNTGRSFSTSKTVNVIDEVYSSEDNLKTTTFEYTGSEQVFTAPISGTYRIELWGASGGSGLTDGRINIPGGKGAYTKGEIKLNAGDKLYIYVGGKGTNGTYRTVVKGGYNGGGTGEWDHNDDEASGSGGGATDVRTINGNWNNDAGLSSRIMVAAGGGGSCDSEKGTAGGTLTSKNTIESKGATQTTGYKFGMGYNGTYKSYNQDAAGAGGGYYGGNGITHYYNNAGTGGSSFISGYLGSVAVMSKDNIGPRYDSNHEICADGTNDLSCSYHYSGYSFKNSVMIDGDSVMPTHDSKEEMTGNTGDGYAKISLLTDSTPKIPEVKVYNNLTEKGVNEIDSAKVKVNYLSTVIKKLYSLDNVNFIDYTGAVTLNIGDTIYAKAVDFDGSETEVVSYTLTRPKNAITSNTFDNNEETFDEANEYRLNVDKSIYNEYIKVKTSSNLTIKLFDKENNVLPHGTINLSGLGWHDVKILDNTSYITFNGGNVYEISPKYEPVIELKDIKDLYPHLTKDGIKDNKKVHFNIRYNHVSLNNTYSNDNNNYVKYEDEAVVNLGETLYAKGTDANGNFGPVTTYEALKASDALDTKAFDNDTLSSIDASSGMKVYTDVSSIGAILDIYNLENGNIKFYNSEDKLLKNYDTIVGWNKVTVVDGSSYFVVTSKELNEIKITDVNYEAYPIIGETDKGKWTISKSVVIEYPNSDAVHEYSLDAINWNTYTESITLEDQATVYAREVIDNKIISTSSKEIHFIDNTVPKIDGSLIPNEIEEDDYYVIPSSYYVDNNKSGGSIKCTMDDDSTEKYDTLELNVGTHTYYCTVTTGAGKTYSISNNIEVKEKNEENVTKFNYTGKEVAYAIPSTGKYKIEAWGAQGGDATTTYIGGYGGYSTGEVNLNANDILYINVGGQGKSGSQTALDGGYNGGGSVSYANVNHVYGSGGGATSISLSSGLLENLSNNIDDILMVAGGGGGGRFQENYLEGCYGYGGSGGGFEGVTPNGGGKSLEIAIPGSQTLNTDSKYNGKFGKGGSYAGNAAGGGGFYGGSAVNGPGAGGSGYIANTKLSNKSMSCYNCKESTDINTKTISVNAFSEKNISGIAKKGNGYVKITYIGE